MFRYALFDVDGERLGDATYAARIRVGETIHALGTQRFRVVNIVDTTAGHVTFGTARPDEVESFEGFLQVEPAD